VVFRHGFKEQIAAQPHSHFLPQAQEQIQAKEQVAQQEESPLTYFPSFSRASKGFFYTSAVTL